MFNLAQASSVMGSWLRGIWVNLDNKLPVNNDEWGEIIVQADKHESDDLKDHSSNFMEANSVFEWSWLLVWTSHLFSEVWWIMNNMLKSVAHQGLIIDVAQINNHFECHKMNDAMGNCRLEGKHVKVEPFTDDGKHDLGKSKKEWDLVTTLYKELWVLISQFHDVEALRYLWVQYEVQSHYTSNFDEECREIFSVVWCVSCSLISVNCIVHYDQHSKSIGLNSKSLVEHLGSLCWCQPVLLLTGLQKGEDTHSCKIVFEI